MSLIIDGKERSRLMIANNEFDAKDPLIGKEVKNYGDIPYGQSFSEGTLTITQSPYTIIGKYTKHNGTEMYVAESYNPYGSQFCAFPAKPIRDWFNKNGGVLHSLYIKLCKALSSMEVVPC